MRLEGIEPSYQAWKASVMAVILQPRISIIGQKTMMSNKKIVKEGNLYNMETTFGANQNSSKDGLAAWKVEARKQALEYLRRANVPNIDQAIKSIFGTMLD